MEYLAPEHQDIAQEGLDNLRLELPSAEEDILEKVKAEETPFPRLFKIAQDFTRKNLPTASIIWEYLLEKATSKQQKFDVMNKLFHVQIATGPWRVAEETAKKLYRDPALEFSSDGLNGLTGKKNGLGAFNTISSNKTYRIFNFYFRFVVLIVARASLRDCSK